MNAGYVAAWLMLSCFILLSTGWRKQLLEDLPAAHAVSFVVLMTTAAAAASAMPAGSGIGPLPWMLLPQLIAGCCALLTLLAIRPNGRRLYAVSTMLLAGAIWIWFWKLYAADPVFVLWNSAMDGPLAAGLAAALLTARFREQFAAAAGASLLAEGLAGFPGNLWSWLDGFAAALAFARGITAAGYVLRAGYARIRLLASRWAK